MKKDFTEEQFLAAMWAKVEKTESCWLWTASQDGRGYGAAWDSRTKTARKAHVVIYELAIGPVPNGLELDHLCRVRHCVRPDHLEPVSASTNLSRIPLAKVCGHGHEWTPANTIVRRSGRRDCRECSRARISAYNRRLWARSG